MKVGNAKGQGPYHLQTEINMIPLIDVALVLLIIFMVVSPFLDKSQLNINLPKVTQASKTDETALQVLVDAKGQISFEKQLMSRDQFRLALMNRLPKGHNAALVIQADKDVSFDNVVFVMDVAKQLKVNKLGVSVVPEITQ